MIFKDQDLHIKYDNVGIGMSFILGPFIRKIQKTNGYYRKLCVLKFCYEVTWHGFIVTSRKHEIPGSQNFMSHCTAETKGFIYPSLPLVPKSLTGNLEVGPGGCCPHSIFYGKTEGVS